MNWDMWGVFLMILALLLFTRERDDLAATTLAAAVWTKFFPTLFLPFLLIDRLQRQGRWAAVRFAVVFTVASAVINAPVLLLAPAGWWHFFAFNAAREREMNLWAFFDPSWFSTDEINRASALLLLWGLVVLLMLQRRSSPNAWLPACCAMLAWFFFLNKVYSPQYGLWIVALLAIVGVPLTLAVAWSAVDLLYFAAHFVWLGLLQYGDAQQWFADHGYLPAVALREGMLLVVVGWCVHRMIGERPRGSPVAVTRAPGSARP